MCEFKRLIAGVASAAAIVLGGSQVHAIVLTPTTDATTLANSILGPGISIVGSSETFTGLAGQAATFTGGSDPVGFPAGIVLMSGNVADIPGPNPTNSSPEIEGIGGSGGVADPSTPMGGAGDADLSALVGGAFTFDAAVLQFDFQFDGGLGGDLFFK